MSNYIIDPKFFSNLDSVVFEIHQAMVEQLQLVGPEHGGKAKKIPWFGHWWPMNDDLNPNIYDANGPLEKYDDFVKKSGGQSKAVSWEKSNHFRDPKSTLEDRDWAGHCNGVAAAGVLETEPTKQKSKNGISFSVGDQKGLMTEYHWFDTLVLAQKIGADAAKFHKLVIDWVGKAKLAVIMDTSLGTAIYNHAVGAYQMAYQKDATDPTCTHVTATIFFVDYASPDYVGTMGYPSHYGKKYKYWIKGDLAAPTSGAWEDYSTSDHPDAIWRPYPSKTGKRGPFGQGLPSELLQILS